MKMYEVDNTGELFGTRTEAVEVLIRRQTQGSSKLMDIITEYVNLHGSEDVDLRVGYNYLCDCMDHVDAMWEYNRQDLEPSFVDEYIIEQEVDE